MWRQAGWIARACTLGVVIGCNSRAAESDGSAVQPAPSPPGNQVAPGTGGPSGSTSMDPLTGAPQPSQPSPSDGGVANTQLPSDSAVAQTGTVGHSDAGQAQDGRDVLLVANKDVGTVALFDARTFAPLGTVNVIPDGKDPQDMMHAPIYAAIVLVEGLNYAQHILVSPDGATLYVARGWLGDVVAIDLASRTLKWRLQTTSFRADHMALSHDGRSLFVSALSADQVQRIDPDKGAFVGTFATGTWPHGMEFSHDRSKLYTGSIGNILFPEGLQGRYELTATDPSTLKVLQTFSFDAGIRPFVISHDDKRMYTQLSWLHGLAEIDLATGTTTRKLELPISDDARQVPRADYPNDAAHHGLAQSDDGEVLCAAATLSDYVALVASSSFTLSKTIPVGDEPGWTVTSLDGQHCFVGSRGSKTVSAISYAEQKEVARFPAGGLPQHLVVARIPERVLRAGGYL
jgi:DNA-binding beta-propeller fold protein YncE